MEDLICGAHLLPFVLWTNFGAGRVVLPPGPMVDWRFVRVAFFALFCFCGLGVLRMVVSKRGIILMVHGLGLVVI